MFGNVFFSMRQGVECTLSNICEKFVQYEKLRHVCRTTETVWNHFFLNLPNILYLNNIANLKKCKFYNLASFRDVTVSKNDPKLSKLRYTSIVRFSGGFLDQPLKRGYYNLLKELMRYDFLTHLQCADFKNRCYMAWFWSKKAVVKVGNYTEKWKKKLYGLMNVGIKILWK